MAVLFYLTRFTYVEIEFSPAILGASYSDDVCHFCVFIHPIYGDAQLWLGGYSRQKGRTRAWLWAVGLDLSARVEGRKQRGCFPSAFYRLGFGDIVFCHR